MEKVTIIVPIYNMEKYLDSCLKSIINQSYKNLEIILIDDGSTDKTKDIIENYKSKDERIITIYQKNKGAPSARNKGIEIAHGKYIMFFDADDVLVLDAIEQLVKYIDDADLALGNNFEIDENGKQLNKREEFNASETLVSNDLNNAIFFNPLPGNKLFCTSIIKNNNIRFTDLKIGQDLDFYTRYLLYCKKINIIRNYIFYYRKSTNSISRTYSLKILKILDTLNNIENAYKNTNGDLKNDYISILKLIHYNQQLSKVPYFKNKIDRKIVTLFFQKYEREIKYNKNSKVFKQHKKLYYEFKIKVNMKFLYESKIFGAFYKWLYKKYKNRGSK